LGGESQLCRKRAQGGNVRRNKRATVAIAHRFKEKLQCAGKRKNIKNKYLTQGDGTQIARTRKKKGEKNKTPNREREINRHTKRRFASAGNRGERFRVAGAEVRLL